MKTNILFKSLTLIFFILFSGTVLMAQSREKDEKAAREAEMKAKQEMLEKQQQEKMKQMEIIYADRARDFERQARESSRARTYVRSSGESPDYFIYSGNQGSQTQLTLRNSFNGNSDSSKGEFEVSEDTRNFRMTINGKVKTGEIRIIVDYPSGDTFKDLTINSAAEITFSQSVTISEQEGGKYIGDWSYKIIAEKAEGSYKLSIMTH
ncbi:MAG: hypothetical protein ABFS28_16860 [Bacteroidota bacterium]